MKDPLHELEQELRQLRPAPVPPRLGQRLRAAVVAQPRSWLGLRWPECAAVAAAAVILVLAVAVWRMPVSTEDVARIEVKPPLPQSESAEASDENCVPSVLRMLCSQRDEGIVLVNQTIPYRQVRRRYIALYSWDHCLEGTRLDYAMPTEEVTFVPVAVY